MKDKKKEYFLNIAGYTVKLTLLPTEHLYFKKRLIEQIDEVWGKGGFMMKKKNKFDFEIIFKGENEKLKLAQKNKGKDHYYHVFSRDFKNNKVTTHYSISVVHLMIVLKEIAVHLLLGEGFMVHASCVMDKRGNFYVFMSKSGGGKTTVANIVSNGGGFEKVSDDNMVIKKVDGEWVYYGSFLVEKAELPSFVWSKKAKLFFIKKGKKAKSEELGKDVLKPLLEQLWLGYDEVDKDTLSVAMDFVESNDFYSLTTSLKRKELIDKIK